jgi:hypothetical protein
MKKGLALGQPFSFEQTTDEIAGTARSLGLAANRGLN